MSLAPGENFLSLCALVVRGSEHQRGFAIVPEPSDEILMGQFQKGDSRAFEVLLRRHERPVYNFLYRMVGNPSTAEDLLQDVFLRVINNAQSFEGRAKFSTWVYTIARNLCHDHGRRQKFRRHASLDAPVSDDSDSSRVDFVPSKDSSPHDDLVAKDLIARLELALETLSDDQREVFLMREKLGLPFKEIADVVGCPENTVKTRMRHALEKLQKALEVESEELARITG
jgi:RNA polymerase sigma-70 factor, ECF subfamily